MSRTILCLLSLAIAAVAQAGEPAKDKKLSGMSVVGNDDAPKSLVIVPWKSSVLGDTLNVPRSLDEGRQPVDRDVFMRELAYYRIRTESQASPAAEGQ
jgi:hypothetical protein